jgi:hypothetical protein
MKSLSSFSRLYLLLLASILAACAEADTWSPAPSTPAYGSIVSEADAIAAARMLTHFAPPMEVAGSVRRGIAGELYEGALASYVDAGGGREQAARLQRHAWRVDITGTFRGTRWSQSLVLDEEFGTVLFELSHAGTDPGP